MVMVDPFVRTLNGSKEIPSSLSELLLLAGRHDKPRGAYDIQGSDTGIDFYMKWK